MKPKDVAQKWFDEVWNKKNIAMITELSDPSACGAGESCSINEPEEFKRLVFLPMVSAFPDVRLAIDGLVAEGDEVVVRWTASATHEGALGNIPPSGRRVRFTGMTWLKIPEGKIVEAMDSYNHHGLLEYLATGTENASVRKGD